MSFGFLAPGTGGKASGYMSGKIRYTVLYAGPTKPIYTPHACAGATSIACSPVLRIPRAGGGTPCSAIHFAAASMLLVRYRIWNGPGPRERSASAATPGAAGRARPGAGGPHWDIAMAALMTVPPSLFRAG